MKFKVITLFPEFIKSLENYSIIGRAIQNKKIAIETINLRDFGIGKYKQVDDKPYGGGVGMLLRVDVLARAIRSAKKSRTKSRKIILLAPEGKKFSQEKAEKYARLKELVIVCGHYEGLDERVKDYVDEVISLGDYVVSGGEIPALAIIDAVSRLIQGVLGNPKSLEKESCGEIIHNSKFKIQNSLYEYPQYTRPEAFEGKRVPEVLLSGDHKKIEKWQKENPR